MTPDPSSLVKGLALQTRVVAVGVKEEMVGLEKEFITKASPNEIKAKPKEEDAVEPRATTTTKSKNYTLSRKKKKKKGFK